MASKPRVAIIGFGFSEREVAKLLFGEVHELFILGKKGQHLEQFIDDERYAKEVVILDGDIDTEIVDSALVELGILPKDGDGSHNGKGDNTSKTVEVAVVDFDPEFNDHIVRKIAGHVGKVIVSVPSPADVEDFKKDGADLVVCAPYDAALRIFLNIMNPGLEDIYRVSDDLFEASLVLPESLNGKTIKYLCDLSGVGVVFITRSIPQRGRGKRIKGYTSEQELFPPNSRVLKDDDTDIRVIGTLKQIRKLESALQ